MLDLTEVVDAVLVSRQPPPPERPRDSPFRIKINGHPLYGVSDLTITNTFDTLYPVDKDEESTE